MKIYYYLRILYLNQASLKELAKLVHLFNGFTAFQCTGLLAKYQVSGLSNYVLPD